MFSQLVTFREQCRSVLVILTVVHSLITVHLRNRIILAIARRTYNLSTYPDSLEIIRNLL